jgi:hypothetical protein
MQGIVVAAGLRRLDHRFGRVLPEPPALAALGESTQARDQLKESGVDSHSPLRSSRQAAILVAAILSTLLAPIWFNN